VLISQDELEEVRSTLWHEDDYKCTYFTVDRKSMNDTMTMYVTEETN
jgi:hypothetical protein